MLSLNATKELIPIKNDHYPIPQAQGGLYMANTRNLSRYRWVILAVSCLINLCIGTLYTWSVFAGPMAEQLTQSTHTALTASDLAIVFSLANSVGPITMILGGSINDKIGPGKVTFVGGCMFGSGLIISGFAQTISVLILGYSLLCGFGMSLVYGCTIGNSIKFFPDKRGMAGGLTTAFYGLSSVILPFVGSALIRSFGVRCTFKILGGGALVVILTGSFFLLQCPPGFRPNGWMEQKKATSFASLEKNWRQMLKDPSFFLLLALLTCSASSGMMIISQASSLAQNMVGMSVTSAATMVSVLALFNSSGRLCAGMLSDRFGRMQSLAAALCIGLFGLIFLVFSSADSAAWFIAGLCCVGVCFGSIMGLFPSITADRFGAKNNSVNYGFMFIGFAIAGMIGPTIMSFFVVSSDNYRSALIAAIALTVLALILLWKCVNLITLSAGGRKVSHSG